MWYIPIIKNFIIKIKQSEQHRASELIDEICDDMLCVYYSPQFVSIELPFGVINRLQQLYTNAPDGSIPLSDFATKLFVLLIIQAGHVNKSLNRIDEFADYLYLINEFIEIDNDEEKTAGNPSSITPLNNKLENSSDSKMSAENMYQQVKQLFVDLDHNRTISYSELIPFLRSILHSNSLEPADCFSLYSELCLIKTESKEITPLLFELEKFFPVHSPLLSEKTRSSSNNQLIAPTTATNSNQFTFKNSELRWYKHLIMSFIDKIQTKQQVQAVIFINKICNELLEPLYKDIDLEIELPLGVIDKLNRLYGTAPKGTVELSEFKEYLFILINLYAKYACEQLIFNVDSLSFARSMELDKLIKLQVLSIKGNRNSLYFVEQENSDDWPDEEDEKETIEAEKHRDFLSLIYLAEKAMLRRLDNNLSTSLSDLKPLLLQTEDAVYSLFLYTDLVRFKGDSEVNLLLTELQSRIPSPFLEFIPSLNDLIEEVSTNLSTLQGKISSLVYRAKSFNSETAKMQIQNDILSHCNSNDEHSSAKNRPPLEKVKQVQRNLIAFSQQICVEHGKLLLSITTPLTKPFDLINPVITFIQFLKKYSVFNAMDNKLKQSYENLVNYLLATISPKNKLISAMNELNKFYLQHIKNRQLIEVDPVYEQLKVMANTYLDEIKGRQTNINQFMVSEEALTNHLNIDMGKLIPIESCNEWRKLIRNIRDIISGIKLDLVYIYNLDFSRNNAKSEKAPETKCVEKELTNAGFFSSTRAVKRHKVSKEQMSDNSYALTMQTP